MFTQASRKFAAPTVAIAAGVVAVSAVPPPHCQNFIAFIVLYIVIILYLCHLDFHEQGYQINVARNAPKSTSKALDEILEV